MSLSELENTGFLHLNQRQHKPENRQIIVLGVARGGTSLVAGALDNLGVFSGDKSSPPVFEDVALSTALEKGQLDHAKSIADAYTQKHKLWVWKRPASVNYFDEVKSLFDNPFCIFVFKDIFSIANRNAISMKLNLIEGLKRATEDYKKLIDIIENESSEMLLVSAEKALQNKALFVDTLIKINDCIQDLSPQREKAIRFIEPNSKKYLDTTRITKADGTVGSYDNNVIKGWALQRHNQQVVEVELYVDGQLHASVPATEYRKHLEDNKRLKSGNHGFSFDVSAVKKPCEVMLKVKGDVIPLRNGTFLL